MKHVERIELFNYPHNRDDSSGSKDFFYKNCYPEKLLATDQRENPELWVQKRPGLTEIDTTAEAEGRGLYDFRGNVFAVVGNRFYREGVAVGVTMGNTTGRVYFAEHNVSSSTISNVLMAHNGLKLYRVTTAGSVAEQTDAQLPSTFGAGIVEMDGYIYVHDSARIYHNEIANDSSTQIAWTATEVISAGRRSDPIRHIVGHLNYIVAIGDYSIEFFYNAGNTTSVLGRVEGTTIHYGTPAPASVWKAENTVFMVAHTPGGGGRYAAMLDQLTLNPISTKPIERLLDSEPNAFNNIRSYGFRLNGHIFYCIKLETQNKTLVYDATDRTWSEWTSYDSSGESEGNFRINAATPSYFSTYTDKILMLDESTGQIYKFDPDAYTDDSGAIKLEIITNKIDFQRTQRKFLRRLELIGNRTSSASNVTMEFSDDDYKTWSTAQTKDMQNAAVWWALGSFARRAFRFRHEANTDFRVEAIELGMDLGTYAQGNL